MNKYSNCAIRKTNDAERLRRYGHLGAVVWLTGLSASGKSTLALALEQELTKRGYSCYLLDGDEVRKGLNSDLGFSPEHRKENVRRIGEVAALFADAGFVCITAVISPYRVDREFARSTCRLSFHEIYITADISVCEARDPKGLYKKARSGELINFTGISAPYEPPEICELVVDTSDESVEKSLEKLVNYLSLAIPLSD